MILGERMTGRTPSTHRTDYDGTFRSVFSDPRSVRDLICAYVDSELGRLLDWSTLKLVATRHASEGFKQSESDMICEVEVLGGGGQVVYLMIEFQSTPDWTMVLRMWNYLGQFCASLAKLDGVKQRRQLPAVLPIVVYNGERAWKAEREMGALVEGGPAGWSEPGPRLGYAFVDVFRSAELDRSERNIADATFRLLRTESMSACQGEVDWLKEWMGGEGWGDLRRTLVTWIMKEILPLRLPGEKIPDVKGLWDFDDLGEAMKAWSAQLKAEGRAEGVAEGRAEGVAEGRAEGVAEGLAKGRVGTLVRQARWRFGEAAASTMAALLGSVRSEAALEEIERYLLTCENGDALIARIRQI